MIGGRAALAEARALAEVARRDPSAGNRQAVRAALAMVARYDWRHDDLGYNPYRDKGGRFAPGAHKQRPKSEAVTKAAAHVEHTAGRRIAAETTLADARKAKASALSDARTKLAAARTAAALARKEPSATNVTAAKQATATAHAAAATAKQHTATVKEHAATHAEAKAAHVEAKKQLAAARSEARKPAPAHESGEPPAVIWEHKKNPKRVEAAKKAAAASVERRREIHSAVASNLPHELQSAWDKEGHKFMQEQAHRIHGEKDRINAASKISEAFAEQYGSGSETGRGYEGDRYYRRAEIEAKHAEAWADAQESKYYAAAMRGERYRKPEYDDAVPF